MTEGRPVRRTAFQGRGLVLIAVGLAGLAGWRHALLMTSAANDNFLHMALAQQLLAGDWPVRDFFDGGWVLQYTLSAVARLLFGNRLLAEAVIVGASWAVAVYLVFRVVRTLTASAAAAVVAALVPILAAPRGYSYPKGIVYAIAAALWWSYVAKPTAIRAAVLGAWAAAAFYWRPDHGVLVAIGVALAAWAAHGLGTTWLARCATAGAAMLALLAPFLLYVQLVSGLPQYVETGVLAARVEHTTQGPHQWPLLRLGRHLAAVEPADTYAPTVALRWTAASLPADRAELLARYGLTAIASDDESATRVRLSQSAIARLRDLVNEPIVEDSAGIDRSTGTLSPASWPRWRRWAFAHAWLRIRMLPTLDERARASEYAVAVFYLVPLLLAAGARPIATSIRVPGGAPALVAFAAFAFLVDLAMLRVPFTARVFDAVVLPAIVVGVVAASLWCATARHHVLPRIAAVGLAVVMIVSVARAADFPGSLRDLASGVPRELTASPPLAYYLDRPARFSLRLAAYVRDCVPAPERLLVLWFEPEIYYYSERLMAQRHLVFAPAWATVEHEQRMTVEKIRRSAPPLALARTSALDEYARATYPGVVDYVEREYRLAATVENDGERYLIFATRHRPVLRGFGAEDWPCFTTASSSWARVGVTGR